ncbi:MAG: hypothetical protein ACFB6S_18990 [Geminicoccaceae bacterium]
MRGPVIAQSGLKSVALEDLSGTAAWLEVDIRWADKLPIFYCWRFCGSPSAIW